MGTNNIRKMQAAGSLETLVTLYQTTRRHPPEYSNLLGILWWRHLLLPSYPEDGYSTVLRKARNSLSDNSVLNKTASEGSRDGIRYALRGTFGLCRAVSRRLPGSIRTQVMWGS
jgi:hypothetical protein